MPELWPFLKAVWRSWWALMSCALFTFLSFVAGLTHRTENWIMGTTAAAAVLLFLTGAFLAWRKEYLENISGPKVYIE